MNILGITSISIINAAQCATLIIYATLMCDYSDTAEIFYVQIDEGSTRRQIASRQEHWQATLRRSKSLSHVREICFIITTLSFPFLTINYT